jgi:hypothetical protein
VIRGATRARRTTATAKASLEQGDAKAAVDVKGLAVKALTALKMPVPAALQ